MQNFSLRLEKQLTGSHFRKILGKFLRKNTSLETLSCYYDYCDDDTDDPDMDWFFEKLNESDIKNLDTYSSGIAIIDPEIISDLRRRLEDERYSWPSEFSISLPNFKPIRLPLYRATSEYRDAIEALIKLGDGRVFLGDAALEDQDNAYHRRERFGLFPLTERLADRLKEINMMLPRVVGSVFTYTAIAPCLLPGNMEWAIRLTIEVFHDDHIFITNIELVELHYEKNTKSIALEDHRKFVRRVSLSLKMTETSRRIAVHELLSALNIAHSEDVSALLTKNRADRESIDKLAKILAGERDKTLGDPPFYPF